jgi:hypothetical protein
MSGRARPRSALNDPAVAAASGHPCVFDQARSARELRDFPYRALRDHLPLPISQSIYTVSRAPRLQVTPTFGIRDARAVDDRKRSIDVTLLLVPSVAAGRNAGGSIARRLTSQSDGAEDPMDGASADVQAGCVKC